MDTNIINNETTSTTTLELNTIIPPEGPTKKTNTNEVSSLDISGNLSNKDSNVNKDETSLNDTYTVPPPQQTLPSYFNYSSYNCSFYFNNV